MIVGIGCDIVDHSMVAKLQWSTNVKVQKRIFSDQELVYFNNQNKERFLSGRFAVKEAVLKCLGTGMRDGLALTDIQTLQSKAGQPIILIQGGVKQVADEMGINHWHVTISHTEQTTCAFVIGENKQI